MATQKPPAMPDMENMQMPSMMPMMVMMFLILALYMIDGSNNTIGRILNYVLGFLDFGGQYPVATLMLAGAIMIVLSTVLRSFATDTVGQAKNQSKMSAFNKELKQARMENNLYKVKKLTEMQQTMMADNMSSMNSTMKVMPYTMLAIIPIFLWIRYFIAVTVAEAGTLIINIPWSAAGVSLSRVLWFMPSWILIYTLISIPLGQIIARVVRTYQFRKRLQELDETETAEAV